MLAVAYYIFQRSLNRFCSSLPNMLIAFMNVIVLATYFLCAPICWFMAFGSSFQF